MNDVPKILPEDDANRELLANVHPADWVNPTPADRYNLVVVGAGTAGLIVASVAAGLGARVALVERHLMGGDCLNVGCVPSKSLIRSARAVGELRDADALGIRLGGPIDVDFAAVMERMRRVRSGISAHDSARRYQDELGIDVFLGDAHFVNGDAVEVGGVRLPYRKAVIASGARAAAPPIEGLEAAGYLTNETVFSLTECPRRLAVIGAGPIGCELAQSFQRLGSQVTQLEAGPQLLGREDRDAATLVEQALVDDGVEIVLGASIESVEAAGDGKILRYRADGEEHKLVVDEILVGAGRIPNVAGLGLETAGVRYDVRRGVEVNDRLQTSNPKIYAAGDVCMAWKFTHAADAAAKIVVQNALFFGRKKLSSLVMPWCTYTDPEVAHVGLYEHEAQAQGLEVETYFVPLSSNDRARAENETAGFVKLHAKRGTDRILGATIVARHAGEMISEVTLAMVAKLGLSKIMNVIHPYPTQADAIKAAAGAYTRSRLTPTVKRLFELWLSLAR